MSNGFVVTADNVILSRAHSLDFRQLATSLVIVYLQRQVVLIQGQIFVKMPCFLVDSFRMVG